MTATFLKSAFRVTDLPADDKPQIALAGRSNVGKSSLINHLGRSKKLARTGSRPGLTQSMNVYDFDDRYYLIDLPGYGYSSADRSRGKGLGGMIADYLSDAEALKLVLLLIDGRHGVLENDQLMLGQLAEQGIPFAIIFNKTDKLSRSAIADGLRRLRGAYPEVQCLPHSVEDSTGLGEITAAINQAIRAA